MGLRFVGYVGELGGYVFEEVMEVLWSLQG